MTPGRRFFEATTANAYPRVECHCHRATVAPRGRQQSRRLREATEAAWFSSFGDVAWAYENMALPADTITLREDDKKLDDHLKHCECSQFKNIDASEPKQADGLEAYRGACRGEAALRHGPGVASRLSHGSGHDEGLRRGRPHGDLRCRDQQEAQPR